MLPIKLTISAFGPYKDKTVIDFTKLGKSGIYLITGKTGAGKTTIFDAIAYALFGKPSGNSRDAKDLRSNYADLDTETFVELIFEYRNVQYTVRRNPTYIRRAKRGGGETEEKASAELHFSDDRPSIYKENAVNSAIYEIIGIYKNQFSQIAMIAQGDFQKLLNSDTKTRSAIFREIFKTGKYISFQQKIKEKANLMSSQIDKTLQNERIYLDSVSVEQTNLFYEKIADIKEHLQTTPGVEIIDIVKKIIVGDNAERKKLAETADKMQSQIKDLSAKLGKAEQLKSDLEKIEKDKAELVVLSEKLKPAKEKYDFENSREGEREKAAIALQNALESLKEYDSLDAQAKQIEDEKSALKTLNKLLQTNENQIESIKSEQQKLQKEQSSLKDCPTKLITLKADFEKIEDRTDKLTKLNSDYQKYTAQKQEYAKQSAKYKAAAQNYTNKSDEYRCAERAFFDEQAGLLAMSLKDNEKCPVCGSTSHPFPAALTDGAVDRNTLEKMKSALESYKSQVDEISRICGEKKGLLKSDAEHIQNSAKLIFGECEPETIPQNIILHFDKAKAEKAELNGELNNMQKCVLRLDNITNELIPKNDSQLHDATDKSTKITAEIATATERISQLEKQYAALKVKLPFESRAKAHDNAKKLQAEKNELNLAFESAKKEYEQLQKQHDIMLAAIKTLSTRIDSSQKADVDKLRCELKTLSDEKTVYDERLVEISARISKNQSAYDGLCNIIAQTDRLTKQYAQLKLLSDTANGSLSGKQKISLETYVQMHYFDSILRHANRRLLIMTGRQYELKRREQSNSNVGQSGLDIDVMDHSNGTTRPVSTLSGGESFLASLSLALGLSDEIQQAAGGIDLRSMFVDEGFGTLDDETLNLAMKALFELSENNKIIGIISHVFELQSRIDKQIVITKNSDGTSKAQIVI